MNNKTIIITGGLGFIGFSLANQLKFLPYRILIIDNDETKYDDNKRKLLKEFTNIKVLIGDICDKDIISNLCRNNKIYGIVHLAAVSRVIDAENNKEKCKLVNINGTKTILETLTENKFNPWIIFGSSREVYGETDGNPIDENHPKKPINFYGESKLIGEKLIKSYAKTNNTSGLILRFSNVYGNRYDIFDRVIPKFILGIYRNSIVNIEGGDQVIDFTHIDDTVAIIIDAIKLIAEDNLIEDFHICPGIGWNLKDVIEIGEKELNKKAKTRINDKRNYDVVKFIGSNEKLKQFLGKINFKHLEEGIRLSIPEYIEKEKII